MKLNIKNLLKLRNIIPNNVIEKGLISSKPILKKFFENAKTAGYGSGAILGFLSSNVFGKNVVSQSGELPSETAARESKRQSDILPNLLKSGAKAVAGAYLGGAGGTALSAIQDLIKKGTETKEPELEEEEIETVPEGLPDEGVQPEEEVQEATQSGISTPTSMYMELMERDLPLLQSILIRLKSAVPVDLIERDLKSRESIYPRVKKVEEELGIPFSRIIEMIHREQTEPEQSKRKTTNASQSSFAKSLSDFIRQESER